mgnify:CR=1 FL=1
MGYLSVIIAIIQVVSTLLICSLEHTLIIAKMRHVRVVVVCKHTQRNVLVESVMVM